MNNAPDYKNAPVTVEGYPFSAKRYPDESFEQYQLRRWNENRVYAEAMKPTLVWDSYRNGTYTPEAAADTFELKLN